MKAKVVNTILALYLVLVSFSALAQSEEDAIFSGASTAGTETPSPDIKRQENETHGNTNKNLSAPTDANSSSEKPLTLGGTILLRGQATNYSDQNHWSWDSPNLADIYLDARPTDRIRALAVGRFTYDPGLADPTNNILSGTSTKTTDEKLDQLWVNFDIDRTVFVTAGKQHVKWGTGHIWNPTDFLQPAKLNPLDIYDQRLGVALLKVHFPWESKGWNFYGYGVFQQGNGDDVQKAEQIGGALRAEILLGPAEIGFDAFVQKGRNSRFGIDASSGLGPFDLYMEAAFHKPDNQKVSFDATGTPTFEKVDEVHSQVTIGGSWQTNINERDAITLGVEGFYNQSGYTDSRAYPTLLASGNYAPFYAGQFYDAVYATLALPRGRTTHTYTLTTYQNASDSSFISRLNYNVNLYSTKVSLDLYGDVHYGSQGGEFRFGYSGQPSAGSPSFYIPTPQSDFGFQVKISI